jgi:hypothetical protein
MGEHPGQTGAAEGFTEFMDFDGFDDVTGNAEQTAGTTVPLRLGPGEHEDGDVPEFRHGLERGQNG